MNTWAINLIFTSIGTILGFLLSILGMKINYDVFISTTVKKNYRREKLEEAAQIIRKIVIFTQTTRTNFIRIIKGFPPETTPNYDMAQEQLRYVLGLFGKEFENEVQEFDTAFEAFGEEVLSINEAISTRREPERRLAEMGLNSGDALLKICNRILAKIQTATREFVHQED